MCSRNADFVELLAAQAFPSLHAQCRAFLRHKTTLVAQLPEHTLVLKRVYQNGSTHQCEYWFEQKGAHEPGQRYVIVHVHYSGFWRDFQRDARTIDAATGAHPGRTAQSSSRRDYCHQP